MRSRMRQIDVIGLQRRGRLVDGGEVAVEHVDGRVGSELAPIGEAQSHALIIVEDGDADHRFTLITMRFHRIDDTHERDRFNVAHDVLPKWYPLFGIMLWVN